MTRLNTSFVLGYHGCDKTAGLQAVAGKLDLIQSEKAFDWLGPGVYFWEGDPLRALGLAANCLPSGGTSSLSKLMSGWITETAGTRDLTLVRCAPLTRLSQAMVENKRWSRQ